MNVPEFRVTRELKRLLLLSGMALSLMGSVRGAAEPPVPEAGSPEAEGMALARELRRHPPTLNTSGTLRQRDSKGKWKPTLPVALEVRGDDAEWESFYRVFAPSGALMETLVVSHSLSGTNHYRHRQFGKAADADNRTLLGSEAAVPLVDSDFWLCDLGLEFLSWPAQRIVRTEMRKGRSCRVLESRNPKPGGPAYARVLSWIDIESGGLMRAEAFDAAGKRIKEFNIGSLQKVGGRYQLKSMEIRNDRTDARTRLEFELEIEDPASTGAP